MSDCLFCKIINKEMASDIVYEDEKFIAFKDISPKAPLHILIVPKKHITSVAHLDSNDKELIGNLIFLAKKISQEQGVSEKGYKLIFNVGRGGGQMIDHIHLHLISGQETVTI